MVFILALGALIATLLGGIFALQFKDKLHLILGFSAGAVIGVAFFDLLPEAINLTNGKLQPSTVLSLTAAGFLIYMLLDRAFSLHGDEHRGKLGAGSLSLHSFLDGLAMGLAFKVSPAVGAVVAIAVLSHDFSDGINTVSMIIKNGGSKAQAFKWLWVDALAPVAGVLVAALFTLQQNSLGLVLSIFAGFFLYIGASDLLPESHHNHPAWWTTFMTVIGVVVMYYIVSLAVV